MYIINILLILYEFYIKIACDYRQIGVYMCIDNKIDENYR